jgi:phage terminase large subunit-like protein
LGRVRWLARADEPAECVAASALSLARASLRSVVCNIIVAGVRKGIGFVLVDATVRRLKRSDWADRFKRTA